MSSPCVAAWISEIQPEQRQTLDLSKAHMVSVPAMVELSGFAATDQAELVIVDASARVSRHGFILNTIPINPGRETRVLSGDPWPSELESPRSTTDTVAQEQPGLDLQGPRTLLLFSQPTGLKPNSGKIQDLLSTVNAKLIDVVTYGPAGTAPTLGFEPIVHADIGEVISRPLLTAIKPWENLYLVGKPNMDGLLGDVSPGYWLNPGQRNTVWQPDQLPEPSSLMIWLGSYVLGWFATARRRGGA